MIKTKDNIESSNKEAPRYLITTSLLNSWAYIYQVEGEKVQDAYNDFLNSLNKIKTPPNFFMERGIRFEEDCIDGKVPGISEVIEGGAFQIVGMKDIVVDGMNILMYGRLDVLKAGVIYDIKRVQNYALQKYHDSYQHHFYLELIPEAKEFHYLINDGEKTYWESYSRDEAISLESTIRMFLRWLKEHNLLAIYQEKWQSKYSKDGEKK